MQTASIPYRRTLTKYDLCRVFGLISSKGKCYYGRLRMENFTNEALKMLRITPDRYKAVSRGRHFTYEETQRIIAHFGLTFDELAEIE